jgi:uncharacterized protein (TIGR02246 family)
MMRACAAALLAMCCAMTLAATGADRTGDRAAIATIVRDLEDATNARDTQKICGLATEDVVMVSKNGDIVAGKRALASYLDRMIGAAPALKKMHTRVKMDAPALLMDKTAIAYGTSDDEYVFTSGLQLAITTRWSASLVKEDEKWRIARVHFSFDLFDNPLLNGARYAACVGAGIAFMLSALGIVLWLRYRKRGSPQ